MSVRIKGLVGFANRVRRELAHPISADRKEHLRREIAAVRAQVERIVAEARTRITALPSPSRRAYEFLANLDLDAVPATAPAAGSPPMQRPPGSVCLTNLKSIWDHLVRWLAVSESAAEFDALYDDIRRSSTTVEQHLEREEIAAAELTPQSRTIRGWLALLAQRPAFDAYVEAVGHARAAFNERLPTARFQPPAIVEFRLGRGLYRLRGYGDGTRVILPTPMLAFTGDELRLVAEAALNGGPREPIDSALRSEACQDLQAELDALAGVTEQTHGVHRDLAASFERVSRAYFGGTMERPRLTWNRVFTGRKFGHYDPIRDTVMITCSLDRLDVPEFALDFVMYHELLHKKLGVDWRNGRAAAHTPEFRAQEERFARIEEARAALATIAMGR